MLEEILKFEEKYLNIKNSNSSKLLYNFLETTQNETYIKDMSIKLKNIILQKKDFKGFLKLWVVYFKQFDTASYEKLEASNRFIKDYSDYLVVIFIINFVLVFKGSTHISSSPNENQVKQLESHYVTNSFRDNLEKIAIWLEINTKNPEVKKIREEIDLDKMAFQFIAYCRHEGLASHDSVNYRNEKKKYKTMVIISLPEWFTVETSLNISFSPFKTFENYDERVYIYTNHYSQVYSIQRKNHRNPSEIFVFKKKEKNKLLDNLNNSWANIDIVELNKIYNMEISDSDCSNIHERLKFLKEIYKQECENKNMDSLKKTAGELSKTQELLKIKTIIESLEDGVKVFFPYRFDFRGRLYILSDISPTHKKEFRFCLYKGFYNENSYEKKYHILLQRVVNCFADFTNKKILHTWEKWGELDKEKKIMILWNLISIAEVEKTKFGREATILQLIENALSLIEREPMLKLDVFDRVKIRYHSLIIDEILEKRAFKKRRYISKDATASCFQHLIKSLGFKDEDSLKYCNLKSESTWYDTYEIWIEAWQKKLDFLSLEIIKQWGGFNRKTLKKSMMIHEYGAGENRCWNDFKTTLKKESKEVRILFKNFYKFIDGVSLLTEYQTQSILKHFKKEGFTNFSIQDGIVNFEYKKKSTKESKDAKMIENKRYTRNLLILTKDLDDLKTEISLRANYTHALDSALVRWFLGEEEDALTIHDCFMVPYPDTSYLIAKINEGMRINFHKINTNKDVFLDSIFSIFILL